MGLGVQDVEAGHGQAGQLAFVQTGGNRRMGQKTFDFRGERKAGRILVDVERAHPHVITGAEEHASPLIPDGKGKVAQEVVNALRAPLLIRQQEKLTVRRMSVLALRNRQGLTQVLTIVEAAVGDEGQSRQGIMAG